MSAWTRGRDLEFSLQLAHVDSVARQELGHGVVLVIMKLQSEAGLDEFETCLG